MWCARDDGPSGAEFFFFALEDGSELDAGDGEAVEGVTLRGWMGWRQEALLGWHRLVVALGVLNRRPILLLLVQLRL